MLSLTEKGYNAIRVLRMPQHHPDATPTWMMIPAGERFTLSLLDEAGGSFDEDFLVSDFPERYGSPKDAIGNLIRKGFVERE